MVAQVPQPPDPPLYRHRNSRGQECSITTRIRLNGKKRRTQFSLQTHDRRIALPRAKMVAQLANEGRSEGDIREEIRKQWDVDPTEKFYEDLARRELKKAPPGAVTVGMLLDLECQYTPPIYLQAKIETGNARRFNRTALLQLANLALLGRMKDSNFIVSLSHDLIRQVPFEWLVGANLGRIESQSLLRHDRQAEIQLNARTLATYRRGVKRLLSPEFREWLSSQGVKLPTAAWLYLCQRCPSKGGQLWRSPSRKETAACFKKIAANVRRGAPAAVPQILALVALCPPSELRTVDQTWLTQVGSGRGSRWKFSAPVPSGQRKVNLPNPAGRWLHRHLAAFCASKASRDHAIAQAETDLRGIFPERHRRLSIVHQFGTVIYSQGRSAGDVYTALGTRSVHGRKKREIDVELRDDVMRCYKKLIATLD